MLADDAHMATQVQAYRWHTVTVHGRSSHTGTTSFAHRADALLTSANLILASHRIAVDHSSLASTGILTLQPGSVNTVPGTVRFSLDIRAAEDERLMAMEQELKTEFEKLAKEGGCGVEWRLDAPSKAIKFHDDCIQCVQESCEGLFGERTKELTAPMISGAGEFSTVTPTFLAKSTILEENGGLTFGNG